MTRIGSMFTIFFRDRRPTCFDEVKECDVEAYGRFHHAALNTGIYLPPSQYEVAFLNAAMTELDVRAVVEGLNAALVAASA